MKVQRKVVKLFGKNRTLVGLGGIEDPNIIWYLDGVEDAKELYDGGLRLEDWTEGYLMLALGVKPKEIDKR